MTLEGVVVEGQKLGRKLGFPTANIVVEEDLSISNGVYRSSVEIGGVDYLALSNVGHNPTVGGVARRVESFIIGFDGDLYGQRLRVHLLEYLRPEIKFSSVEELRVQISKDIESVL